MLAFYKGKSLISLGIQLQTWSKYSHVSWVTSEGKEIEAWQGKGVCCVDFGENHTPGTEVCFFHVPLTQEQILGIESFLFSQLNKGYDYFGVAGFLFRQNIHSKTKVFCAELDAEAFASISNPLLNHEEVPTYKVSPGQLAGTPKAKKVGTIFTGKNAKENAKKLISLYETRI